MFLKDQTIAWLSRNSNKKARQIKYWFSAKGTLPNGLSNDKPLFAQDRKFNLCYGGIGFGRLTHEISKICLWESFLSETQDLFVALCKRNVSCTNKYGHIHFIFITNVSVSISGYLWDRSLLGRTLISRTILNNKKEHIMHRCIFTMNLFIKNNSYQVLQ